jgi:hypothetical protein
LFPEVAAGLTIDRRGCAPEASARIGRADGLRQRELRLQEWVGYPVAELQQASPGQCYRQGAAPPDGVG